jgi:uncharacterized iron-regulated membrane protein
MKQNQLYLLIGLLAVLVVALAGYLMWDASQPSGVEIRIDEGGISVEEN